MKLRSSTLTLLRFLYKQTHCRKIPASAMASTGTLLKLLPTVQAWLEQGASVISHHSAIITFLP